MMASDRAFAELFLTAGPHMQCGVGQFRLRLKEAVETLESRRLFWRYFTTNPRALYLLFDRSRPVDTERYGNQIHE